MHGKLFLAKRECRNAHWVSELSTWLKWPLPLIAALLRTASQPVAVASHLMLLPSQHKAEEEAQEMRALTGLGWSPFLELYIFRTLCSAQTHPPLSSPRLWLAPNSPSNFVS